MQPINIVNRKTRHDRLAPFWAAGLIILGTVGVSTIRIDWGYFWKGYVLDMTGPAWNYILFRGLFTAYSENIWTRFFTPVRTLIIFLIVCFGIETAQYLHLYDATFDPWDFLAYISILAPLFLLDTCVSMGDDSHKTKEQRSKNKDQRKTVNTF
ncbi:hypothetical protein JW948_10250 [bacterium]|nr:hypothetical protein [bacterium]